MIARATLRAPFAAVVVTGDLSQSVGRPVSRGDVLFELAPLDHYRMNAVAPEADIGFIKPGQRGELLLSALPGKTYAFEIASITSVAQAGEGVAMPKGWKGHWSTPGYKKYYVTYTGGAKPK